mgnify:CR=1 FL=1
MTDIYVVTRNHPNFTAPLMMRAFATDAAATEYALHQQRTTRPLGERPDLNDYRVTRVTFGTTDMLPSQQALRARIEKREGQ